jgi:serine O-acetyltransferase
METNGRDAVAELLQTYSEGGGINYIDAAATLPSRAPIEAACRELMSLMFPGFRGALTDSGDLAEVTRKRMENLRTYLKPEICKSFGRLPASETTERKAEELLTSFMNQLPGVRRVLWTDVDAAYEGDPAAKSYEEVILAYPAIEAIAIQRMAHVLYEEGVMLIARIMTEWAHSRTGIDIHPGAKIGSHFFIDHGTGVVIGESCEIGSRVKLYHAVTLGARSLQKDEQGHARKGGKRHPRVEDDVTIYPNSTVLGGETVIGRGSTIGGNVFLTQSVPPNSLVFYEDRQVRVMQKRSHNGPHDGPQV